MSLLYRGRFAPAPSGPLHFGSIISALGSCLRAKSCSGKWLLRIEDLDTPGNRPGATETMSSAPRMHSIQVEKKAFASSQRRA